MATTTSFANVRRKYKSPMRQAAAEPLAQLGATLWSFRVALQSSLELVTTPLCSVVLDQPSSPSLRVQSDSSESQSTATSLNSQPAAKSAALSRSILISFSGA